MELNYPQIERRKDHVTLEERFNRQDLMLLELKILL